MTQKRLALFSPKEGVHDGEEEIPGQGTPSSPETESGFDHMGNLKLLLGIDGSESDGLLQLCLDITRQAILNYCNRDDFPPELDFTLCCMAADSYRECKARNATGDIVGGVSSISEDGRSISYAGMDAIRAGAEDRIAKNTELNRFKKLYRL